MDGVMQSPGAPEEDPSGDFKQGGWVPPLFDDYLGKEMGSQMAKEFDLLLGRKTYEIFASYWPFHVEEGPEINKATKYVVTNSDKNYTWKKTVILKGDSIEEIKKLKETKGPDIQVHGSSNLIQTLLQHDLVDELWLKIFPLTLGHGKRLFTKALNPSSFTLKKCDTTPKGVIIANYTRTGGVEIGTVNE